jgi:phage N-6-adenine-methyltransferase
MRAALKTLFSSNDMTWETPQHFFSKLDAEFGFNLDPCASPSTAKCSKYYTEEDDGLAQDWGGHTVFCNPPYGRGIKKWIQKAYYESLKPNTKVVLLIPSRTDTIYWHDYVMRAKEIRFVRGRLKFGTSKNSAPFPSAVVIFDYDGVPTIKTMEV